MVGFVLAKDLGRPELKRRLRSGALVRVGRGVYAPPPTATAVKAGAVGGDRARKEATSTRAVHQLQTPGQRSEAALEGHGAAFGEADTSAADTGPYATDTVKAAAGKAAAGKATAGKATAADNRAGRPAAADAGTDSDAFDGRGRPAMSPSLAAYLRVSSEAWRRDLELQVLQWGPGAVVARSSAAALWGLDGFEPPVPRTANVSRTSGLRHQAVRRVAPLEPIATRAGFDVTGVAQTLIELGAGLEPRPGAINDPRRLRPDELVELAVESALHQGLVKESDLLEVLAGCGNRRAGAAVLQAVLGRRPFGAPPTESYLETRGLQVLRNGGVSPGQRQVEIHDRRGRYLKRVDLLLDGWLIVEFDGEAYHDPERDRELRSAFTAAGFLVLPFDFEQVTRFPKLVMQRVTDARSGPFR